MEPDDPRHGDYAGVIAHSRTGTPICPPCRKAQRRMNKGAHLDRARGNPRTVNLGQDAWNIINTWPRNQLHQATGIRVDKIIRYHNAGPTMRVHRTTRDKFLAAGPAPHWTPVGIQRRLMALGRLGWSMRAIANTSGLDVDGLKRLWKRDAHFVRADVAAGVLDVYDRLSMQPPPDGASATRARREAAERGWAPPLAWEDIDDKDEQPAGTYEGADRETMVRDLVDQGENGTQIARRLGIKLDSLEQWCRRHHPGLWLTIAAREGDWNSTGRRGHETRQNGDAA